MGVKWRQDSVKAIRAKKEAAAKAEAMNAQAQIAVMALCAILYSEGWGDGDDGASLVCKQELPRRLSI